MLRNNYFIMFYPIFLQENILDILRTKKGYLHWLQFIFYKDFCLWTQTYLKASYEQFGIWCWTISFYK